MTKDSTQSFKEAFGKYLNSEKIGKEFNEKKLIHSWARIMGEPIANRTDRIFIKKGVMVVKLTSAPLKQELTMAKSKVLQLLEEDLGSKIIEDIRFI